MDSPGTTRTIANLPAIIGVAVVGMAIVIAWVATGNIGTDQVSIEGGSTTSVASTDVDDTDVESSEADDDSLPPSTVPDPTRSPPSTTTPPPMPATVPGQRPVTTTTTDAPKVTAAQRPASRATTTTTTPNAANGDTKAEPPTPSPSGEGDLDIADHPIQQPACEGGYITILGSAKEAETSGEAMEGLIEQYPGARYLRTDLSCKSLSLAGDGSGFYVIYFGPFESASDACAARADGPPTAYVKQLFDDGDETGGANCN